jgi:predicted RecA/RadA family phage recombinase
MATNRIQEGVILRLTVGATVVSGDPVSVGNALRGVAITDYDSADGKAEVEVGHGVYDLSVQAADDAGASAVAIGDRLYYAGAATPWLSKKKSGKFFGIAMEVIASGTETINVLLGPAIGPDRSSHELIAAGINVVNDSPLAAEEFIPVTGILATDVVVCTLSINAGSPSLYILKAVAAASPAGITVTASGTFTAGDAINYAVFRASL